MLRTRTTERVVDESEGVDKRTPELEDMGLDCVVLECEWKTPTLKNEDKMVELLTLHVATSHPVNHTGGNSKSKRDNVKRPVLNIDITEDEWSYWASNWKDYKKSTNVKPEDAVVELKECCDEVLRRELHRQHPNGFVNEEDIIPKLKNIAVKKRNRAVVRNEINDLVQDRGETIRRFSGRINSLANVAEYKTKCFHCQKETLYKDEIIKDRIISGLADIEIKKDVLSNTEVNDWTVDDLVSHIEGKEAGKTSTGELSKKSVSAGAVQGGGGNKCRQCDRFHAHGKCGAVRMKCYQCNMTGHLARCCPKKGDNTRHKQQNQDQSNNQKKK